MGAERTCLDESLHMHSDELALHDLADLGLGGRVQIVVDAIQLLLESGVDLLHVVGAAVGDELLGLDAVEVGRALQERLLKVLLVHGAAVDSEVDLHLSDRLQETAVDDFTRALLVDEEENHLQQAVLDARIAGDIVTEQLQTQLVHGGQTLMHNIHTILEQA